MCMFGESLKFVTFEEIGVKGVSVCARVMQVLGHKNIKNTLLYVQLAEELFKDQQEYVSKVAKNEVDACTLVEAGFEYVCDFNTVKIFKKRKY